MSKQHPNVKALRQFNLWRRCYGTAPQPSPESVTVILCWAIRVCEEADKLVNAKGKAAEKAYARLEAAVNGGES